MSIRVGVTQEAVIRATPDNSHEKSPRGKPRNPTSRISADAGSMRDIKFIEKNKSALHFVSVIGTTQQSLDTQNETMLLLFIIGFIPILDIFAALYYLQKYGIYNNSLSLADNLLINSHPNKQLTQLNSYLKQMQESRTALFVEMKKHLADTLTALHPRTEGDKEVAALTDLLNPTDKTNPDKANPVNANQVSDEFFAFLATILASTENSDALTAEKIDELFRDRKDEFEIHFNKTGFNQVTRKTLNILKDVILKTPECSHYREVNPQHNHTNEPINAFKVLKEKIDESVKLFRHDLINKPFRDFNWIERIKGEKLPTMLDILKDVYEKPKETKKYGPAYKSDVFENRVFTQGGEAKKLRDLSEDDIRLLILPIIRFCEYDEKTDDPTTKLRFAEEAFGFNTEFSAPSD